MKGALGLSEGRHDPAQWDVAVLVVSANAADGIDRLVQAADEHAAWLQGDGRLAAKRAAQAEAWILAAIKERWGREGLKRLSASPVTASTGATPFQALAGMARPL